MKKLKRFSIVLALLLLAAASAGCLAQAESAADPTDPMSVYTLSNPIPDIAERVRPAVVQVVSIGQIWDPYTRTVSEVEISYGSGVYIDDLGHIITNNHVVSDAETIEIVWLDGTTMPAEIVGTDSSTDIAVLKFEGAVDAEPVPLGDSDALRVGELAIAIGNPGAGDQVLYGTVTSGIISGLNREGIHASGSYTRSIDVIQTTAQINSGNSGGALLNGRGELIGIPTLKSSFSYDGIIEGTAFAIPINAAKPVIEDLIEYGQVLRPRLGITVTDVDGPEEAIRSHEPAGVCILEVEEGSPAEAAGMRVYDIITHIDGNRCLNYEEMSALLDSYEAGDTVTVSLARYFDVYGNYLANPELLEVSATLEILD